jgi:hypothetical protein
MNMLASISAAAPGRRMILWLARDAQSLALV